MYRINRPRLARWTLFVIAGLIAPVMATSALADTATDVAPISDSTRRAIESTLKKHIGELVDQKNANGDRFKRGLFSKDLKKVDDKTYTASMNIDTIDGTTLNTERVRFTLKHEGGDNWAIAGQEKQDAYSGLHRQAGTNCYTMDGFRFSREGLTMSAGRGGVCERYFEGTVTSFLIVSDDLSHSYEVPEHAKMLKTSHDFDALRGLLAEDHVEEIDFDAESFFFNCDPETCEMFLNENFTGLTRVPADQRTPDSEIRPADLPQKLVSLQEKFDKDIRERRKDSPFSGFQRPYQDGNRRFSAAVNKDDDHAIGITYDNWGGHEVNFWAFQAGTDPEVLNGNIFGYYTEETLKTTDPYALERREDRANRVYEVFRVNGEVDVGVSDPEWVNARIQFGLELKSSARELSFFIANAPRGDSENYQRPSLRVNSIMIGGEAATWVKTGAFGGLIVLPEESPAGARILIDMEFDARAIRKYNHAFSQLSRFGWMPFVRFADFVDEFALTIRTPSQYKVLGIGHKEWERKEGKVLVSHWVSDSPVVFPSVIFGKYLSDDTGPKYQASKLDGTPIPVYVHVDEVSINDWGIRPKQLRPIATQAAVAIDIYKEISGVDYPYGELNLVNDPQGFLYGQAPSSLIYLGSGVFRSAASLTSARSGGTGTSKFLKSVTAHEVGHQWWGSRVSNANGRNYWFVETLAEYFSAIYLERAHGRKDYDEQVDEWRRNVLDARMKTSVQEASVLWSGEDGFRSYQSAVYNKGPYAFHILRETFGDEKFFAFLKQFSQELAAKREIVSRDIQVAAESALGGIDPNGNPYNVDLEWFFDQWIRGIGIPQFAFDYKVRQAEDSSWLIEGTITQRVVIGSSRNYDVLEDKFYRGVVEVTTVNGKGQSVAQRVVVDGSTTPFQLKVKDKPVEVALNKSGGMLAHDPLVNQGF